MEEELHPAPACSPRLMSYRQDTEVHQGHTLLQLGTRLLGKEACRQGGRAVLPTHTEAFAESTKKY